MTDRTRNSTSGVSSVDPDEQVARALLFAAKAHRGQKRKDLRTPYIAHPVAVMRILSSELGVTDPQLLSAALLHDVLEDTSRRPAQLRSRFGNRVTRYVEELTIPIEFHGPAVSDSIKTTLIVHAISRMSWGAILIKLADRTDNLRDSANALWDACKQASYRGQTRAMMRAVARRVRQDPPGAGMRTPLSRARLVLARELITVSS
jgi:(p)ppGpp synthase/HD superfamily hydrolase